MLRLLNNLSSTAVDLDRVRRWVLVLTNAERSHRNVPPVQRVSKLDDVASFHSTNMATRGFFAHDDDRGHSPQDRLELLYPELLGGVGENIAMVPREPEEKLAKTLLHSWMESPGHRSNILDTTYSHMGVGIVQSGRYVFATQLFATLYAELLAQKPPLAIGLGMLCSVRFAFWGGFPKRDLSILVKLPDPGAKVHVARGAYSVGAFRLEPEWAGEVFSAAFMPSQGRGTYELCVGRVSSCLYLPATIRIRVA